MELEAGIIKALELLEVGAYWEAYEVLKGLLDGDFTSLPE